MRAFQSSIVNLWRNRFMSIATIIVIATLLLIFNIILVVHFTAQSQLKTLAQKIDLVVYLENDIEEKQALEMANYIASLEGTTKASYVSKQEALEQFLKSHPKTAEYYQKFNLENTLPPSIRIAVKNPQYYKQVEDQLAKSEYQALLTNVAEDQNEENITSNIIQNLEKVSNFTKYLLYWVLVAFLLGGILMVYNAIHLHIYTRRAEISIMNLVGAGQKFIQLPYLLEALWISLIALMISIGFFSIISQGTMLNQLELLTGKIEIPFLKIFLMESIIVIFLNLITSFYAVYKHTKHHIIPT